MRLWSLHPQYLDSKGLVALWREGLLAMKVLKGNTCGYKNHPQLDRFRERDNPVLFINTFLHHVYLESRRRNFKFNKLKLENKITSKKIPVNKGQLQFEWSHLNAKISKRSPKHLVVLNNIISPKPHPLFHEVDGETEQWEKNHLPMT